MESCKGEKCNTKVGGLKIFIICSVSKVEFTLSLSGFLGLLKFGRALYGPEFSSIKFICVSVISIRTKPA